MLLVPSAALLLARLRARAEVVEQSASLMFLAHFCAMARAAASSPVAQLGPLGVKHADVDRQRGEPQQGHHEDRDQDADGAALAVGG